MDGNHVSLFLTIPSEKRRSNNQIVTSNEFLVCFYERTIHSHNPKTENNERLSDVSHTVSKSREYKSFKVFDFDAPPNIKRVLSS
jgi:hypothetical protein